MSFKPSKYQSEIEKEFTSTDSNILVNAVAGSGKTTTIKWLLARLKEPNLLCAYNKSIADDLKEKCASLPMTTVSTIHSLGFSLLRSFYPKMDNDKYYKLIDKAFKENKFIIETVSSKDERDFKNLILDCINFARYYNLDSIEDIKKILKKFNKVIELHNLNVAKEILIEGRENLQEIDFLDMIYLPVYHNIDSPKKYNYIFVDEVQDLNVCQRLIVLKHISPTGKIVWVGDPKQSIYSFAGADVDSFQELKKLPNTKLMPLSINYRCGKNIIKLAQELVPELETFEEQIEGEVLLTSSYLDAKSGDMVLCRLNAPLISVCIKYLLAKKKAYIKGKDIGENLVKLINSKKAKSIPDLKEKLNNDLKKLLDKLVEKTGLPDYYLSEKNTDYILLKDKIMGIMSLSEGLNTSDKLINRIREIFKEEGEGIILSSIHKAKGLEANNVYLLNPQWFKKVKGFDLEDWQSIQEENLEYVAKTRAKQKLAFITDIYHTEDKKEVVDKNKVFEVIEEKPKKEKPVKSILSKQEEYLSKLNGSWEEFYKSSPFTGKSPSELFHIEREKNKDKPLEKKLTAKEKRLLESQKEEELRKEKELEKQKELSEKAANLIKVKSSYRSVKERLQKLQSEKIKDLHLIKSTKKELLEILVNNINENIF